MNHTSFAVKSLIFLLSQLVIVFFSFASFAAICPQEMVAEWSLEESSPPYQNYRSPSTGSDGACATQCPTQVSGVVTSANQFDADSNTGIQVPGATFDWASSDSFSLELWVRISSYPASDQVLIGRTNGVFDWNIFVSSSGTVGFNMTDSQSSLSLESTDKNLSISSSSLGSRWHHVAVTRNGETGETRLFLDGELSTSDIVTFSGDFSDQSAVLALGWSGNGDSPSRFTGSLDEVAVYNGVLEQTVICSHYYLARHYCEVYDDAVYIMPLGNSITFDRWVSDTRSDLDRFGYRTTLWQSLIDNQYWFDFTGSEECGANYSDDFDTNNAGFGGITAEELWVDLLQRSYNPVNDRRYGTGGYYVPEGGDVTSDTAYLPRYPSDVILLHIGTNSVAAENVDDVEGILDEIDDYSTNVTVVVARIILNLDQDVDNGTAISGNVTNQFNNNVESMVEERIAAGDKLLMVDMEDGAGLDYIEGSDMHDYLHPSASGYAKMAAVWYDRLQEFLPQIVLPEITSTPQETAVANGEYEYQVTATGSPSPIFRLATAPDGMTIGETTGLITWDVPDSVGETVDVRVVAHQNLDTTDVSWAQVDAQKFSIKITETDGSSSSSTSTGCFIGSTLLSLHYGSGLRIILSLVVFFGGVFGIRRFVDGNMKQ